MTTEKFLPYGKQSINEEDIQAVTNALQSEILTRGDKVTQFEQEIADYVGAEYCVTFNSGTSALHAAYYAGNLQPCDRILTSPNTFFGTIAYPAMQGITPTFIDIDPKTGNIDIELLGCNLYEQTTRSKTFIVPVHFAGIPVDMQRVQSMIINPNTVVIEDAAHAIGSKYETGEKVGSCTYSDLTIFSFHPVKTITTGEGGAVTTNYKELYDKLLLYRNNGVVRSEELSQKNGPWYYEVTDATGNYHLTDFQAALGSSQLQRLSKLITKRRTLVAYYREELENTPHITLFDPLQDQNSCYHLMVAQINFKELGISRIELMNQLKEKNIGTQVHYIPLYKHPVFKPGEISIDQFFPNMEKYYAEALSLPLYSEMNKSDVKRVTTELKNLLKIRG